MIQKILSGIFIFLIFSCTKYPPHFLEEKPFTEKITPVYFTKTIDSPSDIFMIDETFRKSPIALKDRASHPKYSKMYFDEDFSPVKIENYTKDPFNNHIYYPYLILKIEKKEGKIAVAVTEKTWQNGQLIASSVKMHFFDRQTEGNLANLIEAFRKNADSNEFLNQIFSISFIADDTAENKEIQTRVAANKPFIKMTGKYGDAPDIKMNVFFFSQSQPEAGLVPISQPIFLRVRFSKYSQAEGIEFTYLGFDVEKNNAMAEQGKKEKEDSSKAADTKKQSK